MKAKVALSRTIPAMVDAYEKHIKILSRDYDGDNVVMCNLLNQPTPNEDLLTKAMVDIVSLTKDNLESKGIKVYYEHFDFHQ